MQLDNLSEMSRGDSDEFHQQIEEERKVPKKSAFSPTQVADERPKFAVKIIRARDEEYQSVALKEFYLLKQLGHPGVIKMADAFVNNSSHSIYLVMELVEGLPLKQFVEKQQARISPSESGVPEKVTKSIVKQLVEILRYLHSEDVSVCHRDLNPNNVMITQRDPGDPNSEVAVKLIDFNVSRKFRGRNFLNR